MTAEDPNSERLKGSATSLVRGLVPARAREPQSRPNVRAGVQYRRRQLIRSAAEPSTDIDVDPVDTLMAARTVITAIALHALTLLVLSQLTGRDQSESPGILSLALGAGIILGMCSLAWCNAAKLGQTLFGTTSALPLNLCAAALGLHSAALLAIMADPGAEVSAYFLSFSALGLAVFYRVPAAFLTYVLTCMIGGWPVLQAARPELIIASVGAVIFPSVVAQAHRSLTARVAVETRAAVERAKTAEAVLKSFEDSGDNWFWELDHDGTITYVSPKFCAFLDESSENLLGKSLIGVINSRVVPPVQESGIDGLKFYLTANLAFRDLIIHLSVAGQERWMSLSGGAIVNERKQVSGHSGIGVDVSAIRRAETRARELAHFDSLTGLANRAHFHDIASELVAKSVRQHAPCALFFIDLDRFKIVNDTLGHPVGDELLRNVAYRVEKVIGGQGQAGRLGGDEFVIIMPDGANQRTLAATATRLIAELSAPYFVGPSQVVIGASVGIAIGPHDGATADDLMRNADLALYAAKESGRGTYRFYDASMRSVAETRRTLEMDLRDALTRGELSVVYQPILDLKTKGLAGFEALLRWHHPVRGQISPEQFVPIAEESGFILQLGEWVLRTALREAARWPRSVRIAINLSPMQLQDSGFAGVLMSALGNAEIEPGRVELEITESVFLQETPTTAHTLNQIYALGVRLALDDFGTGYSSLGYLRKATFNKIKIDRSFVQGIETRNNPNEAIIKAVVALAKSYGIVTTAEGAETLTEIQALHELGCDQVQGYAYGYPMNCAEASELVRAGTRPDENLVFDPRAPRLKMIKNIDVKIRGREHLAVLRNLSCGGAMIETDAHVFVGDTVELDLPQYGEAQGRVCWIDLCRAGITFYEPIQIRELESFDSSGALRPGVAA